MRTLRRMLRINWTRCVTNEKVLRFAETSRSLFDAVRIRKLLFFFFFFWGGGGAERFSAARPDRRHGGVLTKKRETKNAAERQHHPMDWSHLRGHQASRSRQDKMESHCRQRQLTRHAVKVNLYTYSNIVETCRVILLFNLASIQKIINRESPIV